MTLKPLLWKQAVLCFCLLSAVGCTASKGVRQAGHLDETGTGIIEGVADPIQFYGEHISPDREMTLLSQSTYYFEYDQYELSPEDRLSVYAHAKKMIENPRQMMRIEGYTDERGSREYNVILGERRAKALLNALLIKGVSPHRIRTVSYGKEKPAALGHDESAWRENRRAIIVYEVE